jgi:hypothetical protein
MKKLYGTEPLFIFDPNDDANAPDPQYHRNALAFWTVYPRFLRDLFTKAFTEGITDPQHGRVRESNWRTVMVRLRDSIIYCTHCNAENFTTLQTKRLSSAAGPVAVNSACRRACASVETL